MHNIRLCPVGRLLGSYKWFPATGLSNTNIANPTAAATDTIHYQVIASNSFGCADTTSISINVVKLAIAHAGADKTIVSGVGATLDGSIENRYAQFYWQPAVGISNTAQLQPLITSTVDAVYWLTAVSPNNCGSTTDTVRVKVFKDIFIPSAFTPNGDGLNDRWNIPTLQAFTNYELLVYDRYGQLVFQAKNQYKSWDGTANGNPLPAGAYVFSLNIVDLKRSWKGTVLIVR